jgi:hypothetical protein
MSFAKLGSLDRNTPEPRTKTHRDLFGNIVQWSHIQPKTLGVQAAKRGALVIKAMARRRFGPSLREEQEERGYSSIAARRGA